jgi:autotransporter translocation and assembly factor TamB
VIALGDGHVRDYDIELTATRATALASGEYSFLFDGTFEVSGGPRIGHAFLPLPHVQGKLAVLEGVLLYDFADPNNRVYFEGPQEGPAWVYDLDLAAPGRVYWRTPSANIEMKADLTVSQTLDALRVWGTVEALRGDYYFLENKFHVQTGTLTFDEVEPLNPKIDATAQTFVNSRPLAGGSIQREEVDIALADRLRKPKVTLSSGAGRSETEIIRLLTYGRFGGGADPFGGGQQRVIAGTMGGQYLVRQLAREVPEAASLLREVDVGTAVVNSETGGRVVPSVGVSHYLTSDFLLRYSQLLGGVQWGGSDFDVRHLGAEYRISKIFYLTGEVVERRTGSVLTPGASASELDRNLDLRARHEW